MLESKAVNLNTQTTVTSEPCRYLFHLMHGKKVRFWIKPYC